MKSHLFQSILFVSSLIFLFLYCSVSQAIVVIDSNDIITLTGNEKGSGKGTLDYVLFSGATALNKIPGVFDGDDACTDMPSGSITSVNESYITSIGELRRFYRLNFPDSNSPTGSSVNEMLLYVDLNTSNQPVLLDDMEVVIDYDTIYGDMRDDPCNNDIPDVQQNLTETNYTYNSGGYLEAKLLTSYDLNSVEIGSGWPDHGISLGINPFDDRFADNTRILFHWESSNHTTAGEEVYLSGKFAKGDIEDINDHVSLIEIDNCFDYEDPCFADDTLYEFHLIVETDDTIELIQFTTPQGNTFEIPMLADQEPTSEIQTHWEFDEETGCYVWEYGTEFNDVNELQPYGDGMYTITVYYSFGGQGDTTAKFYLPDDSGPIPQPTQEPVITYPGHFSIVSSPVTVTWEECTDLNVNSLRMSIEELYQSYDWIENIFDVNETSWGPLELADYHWEVDFDFRHWYESLKNDDGITLTVGKYSEGDYEFIVSEFFWPLRVAQQYEYTLSDSVGKNWTELLIIDSQADINSVNYFNVRDGNDGFYVRSTLNELYEYNSEGEDFLQHQGAPVGTKWSFHREHWSGFDYKVIEIVSIEAVTVPYGNFSTAYKNRRFRCVDPNDLGRGKSPNWYEWIVPGIGWVKSEDYWVKAGEEAPVIRELIHIYHPDFNNDGNVNLQDFSTIAMPWQAEEGDGNYNQECDLSYVKDKVINIQDLAVFLEYWLSDI